MRTLHILKTEPDETTAALIAAFNKAEGQDTELIRIDDSTDYDELIDLIFEHDRVISWW